MARTTPIRPALADPGDRRHSNFAPRQETLINASKIAVPVTVALGVFWIVSQFIWGAGSRVSGSEKDIAYLTSKCDALQLALAAGLAENKLLMKEDHDVLIEQRVKLASLKEYVDAELSSKPVMVTLDDKEKKK
jgi:hypothetical protein